MINRHSKNLFNILFCIIAISAFTCCNIRNPKAENEEIPTSIPDNPTTTLTAKEIYELSIDKVAMITSYQDGVPYSQGSGFFIDSTLMVTNFHCIENSDYIEFKMSGKGEIYRGAKIIKISPQYDLALIKTGQSFSFLQQDSLQNKVIGSTIYAIGNPRGLEGTISDGIISGIRENADIKYLQITAPISPGNSGSPIINDNGKVIAVATFTYRNGQNLNFAMPIEYISECYDISSVPKSNAKTKKNVSSNESPIIMNSYIKSTGFQQASFHNKTNETITNILGIFIYRQRHVDYAMDYSTFKFKYFKTWLGEIIHYQVFSAQVEIAPNMSKLVNIAPDKEIVPHEYCRGGCTGCDSRSSMHFDCEFRLLSYEIAE